NLGFWSEIVFRIHWWRVQHAKRPPDGVIIRQL
ncbi:MAG: hypothetical protein ACI9V1_003626, partial [Spirosomataceae bacterium]